MLTVGPVHLEHLHLRGGEVAGQARPPRAGALDADRDHGAEAPQPAEQGPVAGGGGRERLGAQQLADAVEGGGDVEVLVGVDAAGDAGREICHGGGAVPFQRRDGTHSRAADRTVTGLLVQAPIRSRSPNWLCQSRASLTRPNESLSRHSRGKSAG